MPGVGGFGSSCHTASAPGLPPRYGQAGRGEHSQWILSDSETPRDDMWYAKHKCAPGPQAVQNGASPRNDGGAVSTAAEKGGVLQGIFQGGRWGPERGCIIERGRGAESAVAVDDHEEAGELQNA